MSTSLQIFTVYKSFRGVCIFVKDTHVFYVNNAGKALFVWFRRRKDDEHLTSFVLGKYQQQEPRTKTVNLQAELVNICHYLWRRKRPWLSLLHSQNTFAVPKFTDQQCITWP